MALKLNCGRGDTTYKNNAGEKKMDFLKEILGDELFAQVAEKINAHNGNEANKDKQVKIGNLGSGEYVGKGKYDALNEMLTGKQTELDTANGLIEQLRKSAKGNEELQGKIAQYDKEKAELVEQLAETRMKSAIKVALLAAKALDVPYLTFKLDEKLKAEGRTLELDENENIKGWDDILSGLKTQLPNQFEAGGNKTKVEVQKLPDTNNNGGGGLSRADFLKKPYAERAAFANKNPEAYKTIMGH